MRLPRHARAAGCARERSPHGTGSRAHAGCAAPANEIDVARAAKLGQTLRPGVFSFPDGLRVNVESTTACEYDVSVPCPFGANYRAYAVLGDQAAEVEIKSKVTRILGHTLEMGRGGNFVVRK